VDHRADIYAVGVMLYQMITGKVPHGMFKPPSKQVPGLDPSYDAMIMKAMRADRDRRYQSIQELHRDLCDILTGGTLKAEPAATPAPSPAAVPSQALPGLKSRLSSLLARIRPLTRSATAGGTVVMMVTIFVVTIVFVGYAAMAVTEKIWPHQPSEPQPASKPSLASAPAPPVQAPMVPPQPTPSVLAPTPAAKPATPSAAVPAALPVASITPVSGKELAWMDDKAQVITAEFVRLTGDKVVLKNQANGEMTLALNHLSPASQKLAEQLAAASIKAAMAPQAMPKPSVMVPSSVGFVLPNRDAPQKLSAHILKDDIKLARLKAEFDKRYIEDVQQPYQEDIDFLKRAYLETGLLRARADAQKKSLLDQVSVLDAEIRRMRSSGNVPSKDAPDTPASIVALREVFRKNLAIIITKRDNRASFFLARRLQQFDAYIKELKNAGKLNEAARVQAVRDSKAELKLK
jgi:predicted outer membrane protein